ncbi:MAG: sulfur carrier protein ThiS [Burkholderiales bacterium]|uniref:sulfur carrier protein ThiS n=1 Tax=Ottowia sp. TaxID=1898956 RepID=UPI001AC5B76F|nr:sulfur carrier protein ThiS [Ottowia sp.]MBN9404628.1 sulfur carrier protein ThiS [Burkholderiales bacterium]MBS0404306.1 sulfur carrier protein ThiS [Pseudomonadota bacterium]MBS0415293.1 sulfur carrier protein ThiS [Pseudomonadota bacterium]HMN58684.1 sulfur carrier protein ThiS [Ottowia sp.]
MTELPACLATAGYASPRVLVDAKTLENPKLPAAAAPPAGIILQLDGQPHPVPAGTTLAELVATLGHEAQAVSTAVNGEFVARAARAARPLREGDAVLLFRPIVGG